MKHNASWHVDLGHTVDMFPCRRECRSPASGAENSGNGGWLEREDPGQSTMSLSSLMSEGEGLGNGEMLLLCADRDDAGCALIVVESLRKHVCLVDVCYWHVVHVVQSKSRLE